MTGFTVMDGLLFLKRGGRRTADSVGDQARVRNGARYGIGKQMLQLLAKPMQTRLSLHSSTGRHRSSPGWATPAVGKAQCGLSQGKL
ncbi:hypothetical protein [Alcaligenes sp. Marseille-Q7550]